MQLLFLPSWFPTNKNPFNGIFILRHAKAIALKHQVNVVFAKRDDTINAQYVLENKHEGNLSIHICYYKGSNTFLVGKLLNFKSFLKAWNKAFNSIGSDVKFDLVHIHVAWPVGMHYWRNKKLQSLPLLISEHWSGYLNEDGSFKRQIVNQFFTKKVFRKAAAVTVVSEKNKQAILQHRLHHDVRIVSNVVDDKIFYFEKKIPHEFIHFIHVSSFVEREKNIVNLLKAFEIFSSKYRKVKLTLAGSESNFKAYEKQYNQLVKKDLHIDFVGALEPKQVASLMRNADAFVLPSFFEGQPCVLLESICCGLPFIATSVGGIPEIANAENAILIEGFEPQSIVDAMEQFIEKQVIFNREEIAIKAKKLYSPEMTEATFTNIYQDIIGSKHAR